MAFFQTIDALEKNFDEQKEVLKKNLRAVMEYVLRPENMMVSCTSKNDGLEAVKREIPALKAALYTEILPEYEAEQQAAPNPVWKEGIDVYKRQIRRRT